MNAKISVFVISFETFTYLLLYNLRNCTIKFEPEESSVEFTYVMGAYSKN